MNAMCAAGAEPLVLRLLCVKRGLTVKFIYDMVIGKIIEVQTYRTITESMGYQYEAGSFSSEFWNYLS